MILDNELSIRLIIRAFKGLNTAVSTSGYGANHDISKKKTLCKQKYLKMKTTVVKAFDKISLVITRATQSVAYPLT